MSAKSTMAMQAPEKTNAKLPCLPPTAKEKGGRRDRSGVDGLNGQTSLGMKTVVAGTTIGVERIE
jgi:hypothetical protein